MPCYTPNQAIRSHTSFWPSGKAKLIFLPKLAMFVCDQDVLKLPCGQCVGCRLEYSRQWAIRCMHEASLYSNNCFITLTYNDSFLPSHGSLYYPHFTDFMKRLRRMFVPICPFPKGHPLRADWFSVNGIRYFMGPEYGDKSGRPHYHAILFNHSFTDTTLLKMCGDYPLYRSDTLDSLWSDPDSGNPYGYASVGTCTFESAAYVARYMMKKVKGADSTSRYYSSLNYDNTLNSFGELFPILPEKAKMSLKPGIAFDWFRKYYSDVYPNDSVVINEKQVRPPRYYDNLFSKMSPDVFEDIKNARVDNAALYSANNTHSRLAIRHKCKLLQLTRLIKPLEL